MEIGRKGRELMYFLNYPNGISPFSFDLENVVFGIVCLIFVILK